MDVLGFFGWGLKWAASYGWYAFVLAGIVIGLWVFTGPPKTGALRLAWAGIMTAPSLVFTVVSLIFPPSDGNPFMMLEPMVAFAVFCAAMILKNHTFVTAAVGVMVSIIVAAFGAFGGDPTNITLLTGPPAPPASSR